MHRAQVSNTIETGQSSIAQEFGALATKKIHKSLLFLYGKLVRVYSFTIVVYTIIIYIFVQKYGFSAKNTICTFFES